MHKKTTYQIPEETPQRASEAAVAYAAPQTAPPISTVDALWTLIQTQDEQVRSEIRYRLDSQSVNKEALRLDRELEDILHNDEYLNAGMLKPSATTLNNVREFIRSCPNEFLLHGADLVARMNATILLDWYLDDFEATVNIGENGYSYGILSHKDNTEYSGNATLSDRDSTADFYKKLAQSFTRSRIHEQGRLLCT